VAGLGSAASYLPALDPATAGPELRTTAGNDLYYLLMWGEYDTAFPLAEAWHGRWQAEDTVPSADDRPDSLTSASNLAATSSQMGQYEQARRGRLPVGREPTGREPVGRVPAQRSRAFTPSGDSTRW
jgi:hypothetical protein